MWLGWRVTHPRVRRVMPPPEPESGWVKAESLPGYDGAEAVDELVGEDWRGM